jgi:hypothetical protein
MGGWWRRNPQRGFRVPASDSAAVEPVAELEILVDPSSPRRILAMRDTSVVATVEMQIEDGRWRAAVALGAPLAAADEPRRLLRAVRAATGASGPLTLDTTDVLLRYEARRAGLSGGLRTPLTGVLIDACEVVAAPVGGDAELLAEQVSELVPAFTITARPARGLARRATSGLVAMIDLTVRLPGGSGFLVACPGVVDPVAENLALAIDTAGAVRSRFPLAADAIGTISFDHAHHGLKASRYAGMAHQNLPLIHLNASLASAAGLVALARRRITTPSRRPPAPVPPPATVIDGIAAHEAWHQLEAAFEARWYQRTIEFRRALGGHFGVATLEHAVLGGTPGASPSWRAAYEQLTGEVSPYAGTTTREATAELFKLWWCSPDSSQSPAARVFGEALALLPSP